MEAISKCGFVTIIGVPNAGKSSLTNLLTGAKVTIVSPKVQTTRTPIKAIAMIGNSQVIFIDTPGIFKNTKQKLERAIVASALEQLTIDSQLLLLLDPFTYDNEDNQLILSQLEKLGKQVILVINKIDLVKDKSSLLPMVTRLASLGLFSKIFLISATNNDGVEDLKSHLAEIMPISPFLYPEDQLTDSSSRFMAQEITREKLFIMCHQELPYNLVIETEEWKESKGAIKISQVIIVTRESHKKIIIGQKGEAIKKISMMARQEISQFLGCKIHLFLYVKVRGELFDKPETYANMGLAMPKK